MQEIRHRKVRPRPSSATAPTPIPDKNGTFAISRPEIKRSLGCQAASPKEAAAIGTVIGINPVNQPCVMKLSAAVRESLGVSP